MVFVGLDTHHETSTCCVLDDRGQRLEGRTIKGSWTETARYLQALQQRDGRPMAVCYEASCGYGALHDVAGGRKPAINWAREKRRVS